MISTIEAAWYRFVHLFILLHYLFFCLSASNVRYLSLTAIVWRIADGHEIYCRLCGNGGDIYGCDEQVADTENVCPYSFCVECIERNFGQSEVSCVWLFLFLFLVIAIAFVVVNLGWKLADVQPEWHHKLLWMQHHCMRKDPLSLRHPVVEGECQHVKNAA